MLLKLILTREQKKKVSKCSEFENLSTLKFLCSEESTHTNLALSFLFKRLFS